MKSRVSECVKLIVVRQASSLPSYPVTVLIDHIFVDCISKKITHASVAKGQTTRDQRSLTI